MKINFSELKKAMEYIAKHSDQCNIDFIVHEHGTVKDSADLSFNTIDNDKITITLFSDEKMFSKITRMERF